MKNLVRGTVAAMIVSVGVLGSAMSVCAAPADDVSLHTTQMTFEINEGDEPHEITDAERQQLRENLARENSNHISFRDVKEVTEGLFDFIEDMRNLFD